MSEFDHLLLLLAGGDDDEYDRLAGGLHGDHPIFEAAYTRIQQLDAELAGEESRVYELQGELAAAQAEARQQRGRADSLEAEVYELQEELARVREVADGMREHADSCGHYSERSKANAVGYWHARLVDALSQPAEQPAAQEADLPLMARRPRHKDNDLGELYENGKRLCITSGEPPLRKPMPGFVLYRIATHDEHGLPVIPREADMPEGATHKITWLDDGKVDFTDCAPMALEANRSGGMSERIEDYNEHGQEGREDA